MKLNKKELSCFIEGLDYYDIQMTDIIGALHSKKNLQTEKHIDAIQKDRSNAMQLSKKLEKELAKLK